MDACFYWYDNNWHYLRQWDHLKQLKSSARLPIHLLENVPDYDMLALSESDSIMSRTISMLIKLSWTEDELMRRTDKIVEVLKHSGL